jgi:hypothetical protein
MSRGLEYSNSVRSIKLGSIDFGGEGFNGYLSTDVEIDVLDLMKFSEIYTKWYSLNDADRVRWYNIAQGKN